jgi:hypothetical protein
MNVSGSLVDYGLRHIVISGIKRVIGFSGRPHEYRLKAPFRLEVRGPAQNLLSRRLLLRSPRTEPENNVSALHQPTLGKPSAREYRRCLWQLVARQRDSDWRRYSEGGEKGQHPVRFVQIAADGQRIGEPRIARVRIAVSYTTGAPHRQSARYRSWRFLPVRNDHPIELRAAEGEILHYLLDRGNETYTARVPDPAVNPTMINGGIPVRYPGIVVIG